MENITASKPITPEIIHLPRRKADTHKGNYGRTLIIGGSVGYTGAPVLSARAASRTGSGLTYVGIPKAIYDITSTKLDEEMPFPLPDKDGRIIGNAASTILRRAKSCDACLIGPGLGVSDDISELVTSIINLVETPLVLDADGLNAISKNVDVLTRAVCPLILTPHHGEFARLGGWLGSGSVDITTENARINASKDFAKTHNCILVLKGHKTVVALPNGESYVNTTGGPAMAKGGTGDVLAGMIAALIAQQTAGSLEIPIFEAVITAVYLHGLAGDMCSEALGEYSVTAGDIIKMLPRAIMTVL